MSTRAPYLHVANGTSTTRTIEQAGIPGFYSIWADPLHDGPVPGGLTDAQLTEVRTRHLAGEFPSSLDTVNDPRAWRAIIEHDQAYDELVLWFEHDLFDQLNLIQLLTWLRDTRATHRRVSLICIDSYPGRPDFKGLGELTTGELAPLLATRRLVLDAQYDLAARAWDAFSQPSPESLEALSTADTSALPFLAPALVRWLQEYPWVGDGLSLNERRLLELAADDRLTLSAAFWRMSQGERRYHITDHAVQSLAETLSASTPALLALSPLEAQVERAWFKRSIGITDAGQSVLAAQQDRVALCGIDRWLGGVHLQGRTVPWRWDDRAQRIVQTAS
jgi:hypothetical protein